MNRGKMLALGAVAALLSACNGWPDTVPFDQARKQPEKYPTYAASAGHPVEFYAGNRRFLVLPGEVNLRTAPTAAVSASGAGSVFSLRGDEAPYSSLFVRAADGRTHAAAPID
jgi:hypothetical protein